MTWKRVRQLSLSVIAAVLSIFIAPGPRAQDGSLTVGAFVPLTGPLAAVGEEIRNGVRLAVESINARGGVRGRQIRLVIIDDQGKADVAHTQAQRLITVEKAAAIVGLPFAESALAVRSVAVPQDVLLISLSSAPALTGPDFRVVLRPIGREDALAAMAADYLKVNFRGKKIGVWLSNLAPSFSTSFRAAAEKRGLSFARMELDAAPDRAVPAWSNDVDAIFVSPAIALPSVGKLIAEKRGSAIVFALKVAQEQDLSLVQTGENVSLIANPGPEFFPQAREALTQARDKNIGTGGYFIYGYAAVQVFAAAAGVSGDISGVALAAAARAKAIPTAIGELRFNANGDLSGWQFGVWTKFGGGIAAVDVCKKPDCKDYEQCPPDCPK